MAGTTQEKETEQAGKPKDKKPGKSKGRKTSKKGKPSSSEPNDKRSSSASDKEASKTSGKGDKPVESSHPAETLPLVNPPFSEKPTTSHYRSERNDRWIETSNAQQYDFYGYVLAQILCGINMASRDWEPTEPLYSFRSRLRPYHYLRLERLLQLPRDKVAALLGLSLREFEQRILGESFSVRETEILLRLYRMVVIVDEINTYQQNLDRLSEWLLEPHASLWDKAPLDLLDTELGGVLVFRTLLAETWVAEIEVRELERREKASAGSTD